MTRPTWPMRITLALRSSRSWSWRLLGVGTGRKRQARGRAHLMSSWCCSAWLFTNVSFWLITALSNLEVEGLRLSKLSGKRERGRRSSHLPPLVAALRSRAAAAIEDFSAVTWMERLSACQQEGPTLFRACARVVVFQLRRLLSSVFSMRKRVKSRSARSVAWSTSSSCAKSRRERRPPFVRRGLLCAPARGCSHTRSPAQQQARVRRQARQTCSGE